MIPGLASALSAGDGRPAASFRNTYTNAASQTTYEFATSDIGEAHPYRVVVVIAYPTALDGTVSSMTIGGVSAALAATSGSATRNTEMWYAVVPTGATATISVTYTAGILGCAIHVFAVYPTSSTPVDALGAEGSATNLTLSNLAKTAGGFAIFGTCTDSADTVELTGTGAETITETGNTGFDSSITIACMYFVVTATTTTDDYTATWSGADDVALVGATWA